MSWSRFEPLIVPLCRTDSTIGYVSAMTGTALPSTSATIGNGLRWAPAAVGTLALAALLGSDDGVVLCPYRRCTTGDCPLCGTTRAAGRLLRGDVAASWQQHPLVLILALQVPVWLAVGRIRSSAGATTWWQRNATNVLLANVGLATALWIVRLVLGDVTGPSTLTVPW